jgi:tRNA (cmo5U34)-methyltransferase
MIPLPIFPTRAFEAPGGPSEPEVLASLAGGKRWEFDASVTTAFDGMLARSIPDYATMRDAVDRLARRFARHGTSVVDLGASRGAGVAKLYDALGPTVRWHLVEKAPAMLDVLRERFAVGEQGGWVRVLDLDLREAYPAVTDASLTLAILTLQFVPVEHRARVLRNAWASTAPGGALIVVEKVLGGSAEMGRTFVEEYHALKAANGYSAEEISAKAGSLEGALVATSAAENERMLRAAGFSDVECFWRWMNFAGWIAVK